MLDKIRNKIETLQEKAIRIIKFLPSNAPVSKEMHQLRILKLKDFITLQNVRFVYDCLEEERMKPLTQLLNKLRLINFTIQDPLIHTNWKNETLKQKNMAASLYWANVSQTGTYSKMIQKLILKKLNVQKSKHLSQTTSLINMQSNN